MTPPRVHEAVAMPCVGCGAALPVDVSVAHAWCGACHAWRPVSAELSQLAWHNHSAIAAASSEGHAHRARAAQQRSNATIERARSALWTLVLIVLLLVNLGGVIPSVVVYGIAIPLVIIEELETWAAAITLTALAIALAALFVGGLGGSWWLIRRYWRRRRWGKLEAHRDWHTPRKTAPAVCGECGAPLTFAIGEHAVTCGYCRSVVVATPEHGSELVMLALSEAQLAKAHSASAERDLLRARLKSNARVVMLQLVAFVGLLACVGLPVLAAGYAWRALTPSLEEQLEELARTVRGELAAGLDAAYAWLDAFWIGVTPDGFGAGGWLQSRWSVSALFHERPVLISVLGNWSDRIAETVAILVVRPRNRDPRVLLSPAARKIEDLGWQITLDYAGIALLSRGVRHEELTIERLTDLARAAYELAEERV